MPLEFKGGSSEEGTGSAPPGPLALHASAEAGDFVVISGAGVDVGDARFTEVGAAQTWVGTATDLSGIDYVNVGFHWAIGAAVFSPGQMGDTASASGSSNPGVLPQVDSLGTVIASITSSTGALGDPDGFTPIVERNQGVAFVAISYAHLTGLSPAAEFATGGAFWAATVLTARYVTVAPPCRLYPRDDDLGAGAGRIHPPPRSHQRSPRRAGGYY